MFTEEEKIIRMSNIYNNQLLSALPLCVHLVCVMGDVPSNSDEELADVHLEIQLEFPFQFNKNKLLKFRIYSLY